MSYSHRPVRSNFWFQKITRAVRPLLCMTPAIVSALLSSSCVYALHAESHVEGAHLPYALPEISAATTIERLEGLLGPPTSRSESSSLDGLVWHQVIRPKGCRVYLLGLMPVNRDPKVVRELVVLARDGRVHSAVEYRTTRSGAVTENRLFPGADEHW
jgi:hypothetical protein